MGFFDERTIWYIRRGTIVGGIVMGMSYFIFAFMESRKANPGSYANEARKIITPGSDEERRILVEQEARVESLFADLTPEERKILYRRYRNTNGPGQEGDVKEDAPIVEKPRVRKVTVIKKKDEKDE